MKLLYDIFSPMRAKQQLMLVMCIVESTHHGPAPGHHLRAQASVPSGAAHPYWTNAPPGRVWHCRSVPASIVDVVSACVHLSTGSYCTSPMLQLLTSVSVQLPMLFMQLFEKNMFVVSCHAGSLCTQKQPEVLQLLHLSILSCPHC